MRLIRSAGTVGGGIPAQKFVPGVCEGISVNVGAGVKVFTPGNIVSRYVGVIGDRIRIGTGHHFKMIWPTVKPEAYLKAMLSEYAYTPSILAAPVSSCRVPSSRMVYRLFA